MGVHTDGRWTWAYGESVQRNMWGCAIISGTWRSLRLATGRAYMTEFIAVYRRAGTEYQHTHVSPCATRWDESLHTYQTLRTACDVGTQTGAGGWEMPDTRLDVRTGRPRGCR